MLPFMLRRRFGLLERVPRWLARAGFGVTLALLMPLLRYDSAGFRKLFTLTECGMLLYWALAVLAALEVVAIPPSWLYSNAQDPLVVAWNWSFLPVDLLFVVTGLMVRFSKQPRGEMALVSATLMFCAGAMALSFWAIRGEFDVFWWGANAWLVVLSLAFLFARLRAASLENAAIR